MDPDGSVIVRAESAGVFFGYPSEINMSCGIVTLREGRKLWYWKGAASISQLAVDGTNRPKECKFPTPVPTVTIGKVIEIIPCTLAAAESIKGVPIWKA